MSADIFRWTLSGFLAPRTTVRALLDRGHGIDVAILLLLLAYLVESMGLVLFSETVSKHSAIEVHLSRLIEHGFAFVLIVFIVFRVGRLAGGTGTLVQSAQAVAWYLFMNSLLSPVYIMVLGEFQVAVQSIREASDVAPPQPPNMEVALVGMVASMLSIWWFANSILALHGFRNLWSVIGAVIGLPLLVLVFAMLLIGGSR